MTRKIFVCLFVFSVFSAGALFFSPEGTADDYQTRWINADKNPPNTPWSKAGRGVSNFFLGWTEMAYQPFLMAQDGHRWPVALGGGLVKGFVYGINRMAAGLYETLTFPIEIPKGYRPLIQPEMPFPREKGYVTY